MRAFQLTLTSANTNYNLLTLLRAIESDFVDGGDCVIQADDDGGTQTFLLGDEGLSGSNYGQKMVAGDFSAHYRSLGRIYARCDGAGKKLNVQVIR